MRKVLIIFNLFFLLSFGQNKIVAIVGNKPIFEKDVIKKSKIEKIDYMTSLNSLIEEKLLLSQAEKKNIGINEEEIKNEIEKMKKNFSNINDFYDYLKKLGINISQLKEEIGNNLKIKKLIKYEIINKIQISPIEIAKEMGKIESNFSEYQFYFKWFDNKEDCERFFENFNEDKLKEMDFTKLKSSEVKEEILYEIEKIEGNKLTKPIQINNRLIVIYLKEKTQLNLDKYEIYKQAKDKIFKIKYSILYKDYIEELKKSIPIKIL
ncbi:MAG: SurA N-terminal domain-containing protein [Candidatus Omnitrophica bacterium]|nr:SurA N-terminal domain-containing protein [Candidatus Omnitrophota bacterium]